MLRRTWSAILVLCFVVVGLVAIPPAATATTPSYNDVKLAPELYVYTNGSAKSQVLDISTTWWSDIKQAYERRMAYSPPGWPTNFIATVEDAVANGGSWGVIQVESPYGNEIRMFATDDPNATCTIQPYATDWWLECVGTTPGYTFASADYITHNSFGGNGCGGGSCSDNGINIYNAPTVYAAGGGRWDQPGYMFDSGQAKIFFLNADMVYPTGYTGPEIPREFSPLEYVALGDSFSSGEGVEPFESGTDVADDPATSTVDETNRCHRSEDAYPRLLSEDPRLGLQLTAFTACSGATTATLINGGTTIGSWGEGSQLNALSTSTDVVTLTIGGNDIGFVPFITACFTASCDTTTDAYSDIINEINGSLPGKLELLYGSIKGKIGADTRVLVVGYPLIISPETVGPYSNCYLLSSNDKAASKLVFQSLVAALDSSVTATYDSRFSFVDAAREGSPFEGRDMCASENYILEYNLLEPIVYTAHPNLNGQMAYSEVLKDFLD